MTQSLSRYSAPSDNPVFRLSSSDQWTSIFARILCGLVALAIIAPQVFAQDSEQLDSPDLHSQGDSAQGLAQGFGLTPETAIAADQLSRQVGNQLSASEVLGPLAPVALSPFFGITLLSGMAIYGGNWLGDDNGLLQAAGPLKNPALFWTFLVLTIVTSIPRFSKISKPFAQAIDKLEAVSGIITLLVIYLVSQDTNRDAAPQVVLQAGLFSFTSEMLISVAMIVNILAINSVKFFFEVLIWLTPVPFLDAAFEVANKSLCVAMMSLYAFSPTLATIVNVAMFTVCAFVFTWVRRREVFYRTMMFDALRSCCGRPVDAGKIIVFPQQAVGSIPAKARCELARIEEEWVLKYARWFRPPIEMRFHNSQTLRLKKNWLTTRFELDGEEEIVMNGSRRYHANLEQVARDLGAELLSDESPFSLTDLRQELA